MPTDEWERGYSAGYRAAHRTDVRDITSDRGESAPAPTKKRKASAYNRKYSAAFRKLEGKYKKKNGSWREGGYRACVKAAHKLAGRK